MGDYLSQLVARKECAIGLGNYALAEANSRFSGSLTVSRKEDASIVTDADKEIEEHLVREILRAFPKDAIVAEEGGSREGSSGFCWYIDPIDGTSNFSAGLPIFAVSLGVAYNGKPFAGVIGVSAQGKLFHALESRGAYEAGTGARIAVSKKEALHDGIVLLAFRGVAAEGGNEVGHAAALAEKIRRVRVLGSVVWSLAMIASGHAKGGVFLRMHSWDVAAGIILVREAGGMVTDLDGKEPDLNAESISLVASNSLAHKELLDIVRGSAL